MRKHLNDYLFSPLSWLLTIFIIALIILVLTFLTPYGVKTIAHLADSSIEELSIKGVSGSLISGLHIGEFIWNEDGNSISIRDIDLKLQHYNTNRGRLVAKKVRAGRLTINLSNIKSDSDVTSLPNFGLPLNINAHLLQLDSLQITQDVRGEDESRTLLFQIKDIELKKVTINDGKLRFRKLSGKPIILDQPLDINVTEGKLNMNYPHDISTSGNVDYKHPEFGNIDGKIELAGTLTNYSFKGNVDHQQKDLGKQTVNFLGEGDYKRVHLEKVTLDGPHGVIEAKGRVVFDPDIRWAFKVDGKDLSTKKFLSDWPATVNVDLRYIGSYIDGRVENNINITSIDGMLREYPLKLQGYLTEKSGSMNVEHLDLFVADNYLKISGKANEPFNLKWQLDANNIKQLLPEKLSDLNVAGNIQGEGILKGSIQQPQIIMNVKAKALVYEEIKQGEEDLDLNGELVLNKDILMVKTLRLKSGDNIISISGQVSEPIKLAVDINTPKLSSLSPDIEGRVKATIDIRGSYQEPRIKMKLNAKNLQYKNTQLNKHELNAKGDIQWADGIPTIKSLIAQIGDNQLSIKGRAISPYDLNWNIEGKKLNQLMPSLSGYLIAKGVLRGTTDKPIIDATLNAKSMKYQEISLDSATVTAQTKSGIYKIRGVLDKLHASSQKVARATIELNGDITNHTITSIIDHDDGEISLKAKGGWLNEKWKGLLQTLQLKETPAGDWHLQNPTKISISDKSFSNDKLCITGTSANKGTSICTTTFWSKNLGLTTKGSLTNTPLAILKPWLPDGVNLNGLVNGNYDIKQNNGKPRGIVKVTFPDSNFSYKNAAGDEQFFGYKNGNVTATINNRDISTKASLDIINRGKLKTDIAIKLSPENGQHTVRGTARFDAPNINWMQEFIPRSRSLQGSLKSELSFSGLLKKPQVKGKVNIINGYLRLPEAGTKLTDINLQIHTTNPENAIIKGKMLMGKGALNIAGNINIKNLTLWKATMNIKGRNILFMNTNEIKARITPNLTIGITPNIVSIEGKVIIPSATIQLKKVPEISIDETNDAFVVGEVKPGEQVSAVKVHPNLLVELGDKVKIDAFGLDAKLSGSVKVTHNLRDILANGSLRVSDGKYQAYGQDLTINNGRLIFNGSPKQVGMDVRATRKIDDTIVGIHLGGSLLKPKSTIFSDPTLPESEALSFLLTGHSLSTSSGSESALLLSAVRGLGISGTNSLIHNIGASLGLDDVNIVSGQDFTKSNLQLGKQLGSKLYVKYLIGLFDRTQKVSAEYKINKVLSLEAQTSSDSNYGLDFIYEIERD